MKPQPLTVPCPNLPNGSGGIVFDEHQLQRPEEILDNVSDAFFSIDRRYNVTYMNRGAERVFGLPREIMIGRNFFALRPQAVGSNLHEMLAASMNSESTTTFNHKGILTGKYYEVKAYPSKKGLSVYFQDITERKENEETISELLSIIECSSDAIISAALDGNIKSFNPGAVNTYCYSLDEVRDQHISLLFTAEHDSELKKLLKHIQRGETIKNIRTKHLTKNGKVISVLLSAFPIRNKDGITQGFSIISRDVTEHENLEQEIAKLDRLNLIGQMAAGIGHEVRNPLTTVRGFLQLFLRKSQYINDRSYFELMIEEIDRANFILSELLSLGKDKVEDLKRLNLNDVLKEIHPLLSSDAMNFNNEFDLSLGSISDLLVDKKEVRQLIFNLFRNGLEAMNRGGKITIRTFEEDDNIVLAVTDEGCGIDIDTQKRIGTPFFTTKDKGTGLGLAVCHSIANRNNAAVDFTTGPDGTTFYVRFKKFAD